MTGEPSPPWSKTSRRTPSRHREIQSLDVVPRESDVPLTTEDALTVLAHVEARLNVEVVAVARHRARHLGEHAPVAPAHPRGGPELDLRGERVHLDDRVDAVARVGGF